MATFALIIGKPYEGKLHVRFDEEVEETCYITRRLCFTLLASSVEGLINKWQQSKFPIDKRLIITVKNTDVDALNAGIRRILKANGVLKGAAFTIERMEKNHRTDQTDKDFVRPISKLACKDQTLGTHGAEDPSVFNIHEDLSTGVTTRMPLEVEFQNRYILVTREFMVGDRVIFAATNKELGIQNGSLGTILKVSESQFIVRIDGDKEIAFNPAEIEGLKHGYAVTTYKSQGSSIEVVYVLHSGAGNSRNTYVNLTRHINEVSLFYSIDRTRNISHLKLQLARIDEKSSSLKFVTDDDITRQLELMNQTAMQKVGKWFKATATAIGDKLHSNPDYYRFEAPPISKAKVEEVLTSTYEQIQQQDSEMYERPAIMVSEALAERGHSEQHVKNEELFALDKESGLPRSLPVAALLHGDATALSSRGEDLGIHAFQAKEKMDTAVKPRYDNHCEELEERQSNLEQFVVVHDNVSEVEKELIARSALSSENIAKVEAVTQAYAQEQQIAVGAGGSRTRIRNTKTAKQRFYEKVDKMLQRQVRDYKGELESLKHELKFKAERIALNLLGDQNKRLSNKNVYRYGERGSFAVSVGGNKAGTWYDFETGIGGDMISLVQRETKKDFKESVEWLKDCVGLSRQTTLKLVYDNEAQDKYVNQITDDIKAKAKEAREEKKIHKLYEKSKEITEKNIASKYLRQERNIKCAVGEDIRTTGIWDKTKARHYPAIVAFARDNAGKITGGQTILLDPETAKKADIDIVKKSFGKISGSFVEVQKQNSNQQKITFIAEGLETALSLKEAGYEGKILCSLGVGNIKTYKPEAGEKIMICADNDGASAKTAEIVENARNVFENQGAIVHIIAPQEKGDFNDVLKAQGVRGVKQCLQPGIEKLISNNGQPLITEDMKKEFELTIRLNQEKLNDIVKLDPKFDLEKFKDKLKELPDKTREGKIKMLWLGTRI